MSDGHITDPDLSDDEDWRLDNEVLQATVDGHSAAIDELAEAFQNVRTHITDADTFVRDYGWVDTQECLKEALKIVDSMLDKYGNDRLVPSCLYCGEPMEDGGMRQVGIGRTELRRFWFCTPCGHDIFE